MKTFTKLAAGALLALSVAAPAFANEPEAQTLQERNTFLYTSDARPIARHQETFGWQTGASSFAAAPGYGYSVPAAGPSRDLGISSQS